MGWISPFQLRKAGILNMNRRNVSYIARYNDRSFFPLVDDKLKTKLLAEEYGIKTPSLRQVVRQQHEIGRFSDLAEDLDGFVIKPSKGSGGKGITVIHRRDGADYVKASGARIPLATLERHLSNILAGLHSLGGTPDVAIVEDLVRPTTDLARVSFQGVPDIRIIVFKGYPVMAMLRLSTKASDGKANLHQGAVGVGLDIGSGRALKAVQFNKPILLHPDTGIPVSEIRIEDWHIMLEMASRCYEATGLGYIGVDLVLDDIQGPLLLELNARPGLAIQMANGKGLLPRLQNIEQMKRPHFTPAERASYSMSTFGTFTN